jgi:2,4-dienoyl-CoA reductase-like NADH-dependent reductase (Old Yellow Enzyme family)
LDGVPTDLVAEYYGQRTGAGLMFTESAAISQRGIGFPGQGNIFNEEQVEGWRKVLKVVHEKGSKLYIQVFHAGRSTHPSFNGNQDAWAPSAVKCRDRILELAGAEYPIPKEMTKEDINTLKSEY